jgi:hypothetical protein
MTLAARQPPYGGEQTSNGEGEWATLDRELMLAWHCAAYWGSPCGTAGF